jgi:hypothetical protein
MNVFISLIIAVLSVPSIGWSQDVLEGVYEGQGQEGGQVRMIVDGKDVGVSIKMKGCLGYVEGYFANNRKGDTFLLSSEYKEDGCAIAIGKHGKFAVSLRQGPECTQLHGAACSFNGWLDRVR